MYPQQPPDELSPAWLEEEEQGGEGYFLHRRWCVDAGQRPMRLDKFLAMHLAHISRTRIQGGIRSGHVQVNRQSCKASYLVQGGDELRLHLPEPPSLHTIRPERLEIPIVYEDEDLVVVNKPAAMVVHPACGHREGTLVHGLLYHFQAQPGLSELPTLDPSLARPGLVHRIDKGTSGLLVVAKREKALTGLAAQFYHRRVQRRYTALVWGDLAQEQGTIEAPLGRSPKDRRVVQVRPKGEGRHAVTHYQVLRRWGYVTLISCRLETGRTHQIRAHMKYLGHPLFGDHRYGGAEVVCGPLFTKYKAFVRNSMQLLPFQALHARVLGFWHPCQDKQMRFEIPLPAAFAQVVARWDRYLQGGQDREAGQPEA